MKLTRIFVTVCLLVPLLAVASPVSADTPCEPRAASSYRYDSKVLTSLFVLRLCEPVDGEVTFEIQFDRLDIIAQTGFTAFILGVTDCHELRCVTYYRYEHGNELARYDIRIFWFGAADDHIGPLVCATRGDSAGCRGPA